MKMTPEDFAYLRSQAQAKGYNPDDLAKVINYESSGRPDVWGGKGGKYYGLIQFGGPERAKYGVDTVHPSATNQLDAMFRFLGDRGFKPGMGLLDLYSTINAGSPGHYSASDGNGTVASHVAKMSGMPTPQAGNATGLSLSGLPQDALAYADTTPQPSAPKSDPIGELIALTSGQQQDKPASLLGQQQAQPQQEDSDAFLRQMRDYHNARHLRAVQGLI